MAESIFPFIQPESYKESTDEEEKEIKWNFERDLPVLKNGEPVTVTGKEAVKVWVWNALKTTRNRFVIYTENYGCDIEELIGRQYSAEVKQLEARRYIEECLKINPKITRVNIIDVCFGESARELLEIECEIETIYGSFDINI